jgi:hypothetical protein
MQIIKNKRRAQKENKFKQIHKRKLTKNTGSRVNNEFSATGLTVCVYVCLWMYIDTRLFWNPTNKQTNNPLNFGSNITHLSKALTSPF